MCIIVSIKWCCLSSVLSAHDVPRVSMQRAKERDNTVFNAIEVSYSGSYSLPVSLFTLHTTLMAPRTPLQLLPCWHSIQKLCGLLFVKFQHVFQRTSPPSQVSTSSSALLKQDLRNRLSTVTQFPLNHRGSVKDHAIPSGHRYRDTKKQVSSVSVSSGNPFDNPRIAWE